MQRRLAAVLSTLAIISLLTACKRNESPKPTSGAEQAHILLLLKAADNPFFQEIEQGARAAIQASGKSVDLQVRAGDTESDVGGQRKALEWYLAAFAGRPGAESSTAVLLTPAASQRELTDQLRQFRDKKIPLILIDTRIDAKALDAAGVQYTAYFGSNNHAGGRLAARELLRQAPSAKHILLLGGVEGQETAAARREGFREEIASAAKGVDIVERTCNWRRDEARRTVEALLVAGKTFDAIFAANDEMALGAVEAIEASSASTKPRVVVGFDAIPEARKAVESGRLSATIAQSPFDMGKLAVECALDASCRAGLSVDRDVPLQIISKSK